MPTGNNSNYDLFWQGALRQRFGGAYSDGSFVPSITINENGITVVQKDEDGEYRVASVVTTLEPYEIQQYDNRGFSLGFDADKEEDKNGFREFIDKLFVRSPKKCDDETMLKNAKPIESLYGF